jgi:hypothetical protein
MATTLQPGRVNYGCRTQKELSHEGNEGLAHSASLLANVKAQVPLISFAGDLIYSSFAGPHCYVPPCPTVLECQYIGLLSPFFGVGSASLPKGMIFCGDHESRI